MWLDGKDSNAATRVALGSSKSCCDTKLEAYLRDARPSVHWHNKPAATRRNTKRNCATDTINHNYFARHYFGTSFTPCSRPSIASYETLRLFDIYIESLTSWHFTRLRRHWGRRCQGKPGPSVERQSKAMAGETTCCCTRLARTEWIQGLTFSAIALTMAERCALIPVSCKKVQNLLLCSRQSTS